MEWLAARANIEAEISAVEQQKADAVAGEAYVQVRPSLVVHSRTAQSRRTVAQLRCATRCRLRISSKS